jgi:hypothetical protein
MKIVDSLLRFNIFSLGELRRTLWLAEMSFAESRMILSRPRGNSEPAFDQPFLWIARTCP